MVEFQSRDITSHFSSYLYFMKNMAGVREVNKRQKQQQRW